MNGVGSLEWVAIEFTLAGGQSIDDVIDELTSGVLRIGIHVIAFDGGGSESFVNVPVPEPGTAVLMLGGLVMMGRSRGRR